MTTTEEFATEFGLALNRLFPDWSVDGDLINGPEGARVRLFDGHSASADQHIDVEFSFNAFTSLLDCVAGFGASSSEVARTAAQIWVRTTGCAVLELKYSRRGEFADHFHPTDPAGFPGWHAILGPVLGYGSDVHTAQQVQNWLIEQVGQGLLPDLAHVIATDLFGTGPHGLKLLFGGDSISEVRVDGAVHEEASRWLGELDWPRLDPFPNVRTYLILVHPEDTPDGVKRGAKRGWRRLLSRRTAD